VARHAGQAILIKAAIDGRVLVQRPREHANGIVATVAMSGVLDALCAG
jgi:hypothetical protein